MSSPDVNIEKQKKRHRTMVVGVWIGAGIALLVGMAALLISMLGADPGAMDATGSQGLG